MADEKLIINENIGASEPGIQGVVTYMSPVEVFATVIKMFDWQKVCLISPF